MQSPVPHDEARRLAELSSFGLSEAVPPHALDNLTLLAAQICDAPIALVSLVDEDQQWSMSRYGIDPSKCPRDLAFCSYAILDPASVMQVPDASEDPRFANSPLVVGAPYFRSYAGAPLVTQTGQALGTLCVIDYKPRELTAFQLQTLKTLAEQIMVQLELTRQLSMRQTAEAARDYSENRLKLFLDNNPCVTFLKDADGRYIYVNRRAARRFDKPCEEWVGKTNYDWLSPSQADELKAMDDAALASDTPLEFTESFSSEDGGTSHWQIHKFSFADSSGNRLVAGVSVEITDIVEAATALKVSEMELRQAQAIAHVGNWEIDVQTGSMRCSEEMLRIHGLSGRQIPDQLEGFVRMVHPDDTDRVIAAYEKSASRGLQETVDFRIVRPDGSIRFVVASGVPVADSDGNVRSVVGTILDITERKVAEQKVSAEEKFVSAVLDVAGALIMTADKRGKVTRFNHACERLSGWAAEDIVGKPIWDILIPAEEHEIVRSAFARFEAGDFPFDCENHWVTRSGTKRLISWSNTALLDEYGQVETLIGVGLDVTDARWMESQIELAVKQVNDSKTTLESQALEVFEANRMLEDANEKLAQLASTDGLTGLCNHRTFQQKLAAELSRSQRHGSPLSIVFLDVDRFKQYNDSFGHSAGDTVLKAVAEILTTVCRLEDTVARYGGEEFAILLPETASPDALILAERVREAVEAANWNYRSVTVSVGVATRGLAIESPSQLIDQADKAMYASKFGGRNRVSQYNSLAPNPAV